MTMPKRALFLVLAAMPIDAAAQAPARVAHAAQRWAVLDRGDGCEAVTRSLKVLGPDKPQARAGFIFDPRRGRDGQFFARLGETAAEGSAVMLTIGGRPFLLASRGVWAWTRDPAQKDAIIALARQQPRFTIRGRDNRGRRFVDRYEIRGAATAIDAAAACALAKSARRP